jgi:hypothetical protein
MTKCALQPVPQRRAASSQGSMPTWGGSPRWDIPAFHATRCIPACASLSTGDTTSFRVTQTETIIVRVIHSARDLRRFSFDD